MKGNYRKVNRKNLQPPEPKPGIDYDEPIGPKPPTAGERFASDHPWLAKAGAAVKERSAAVAKDVQRPNSYRGVKPNTVMGNPDPFGMSRTHSRAGRSMTSGSGFSRSPWGPADNLGIGDPFGIAPRPKKKRKRQPQNNFADPFHIPRGLRDIF